VTKCPKLPAEMVGTNTSLHTDQARRHIRQPCFAESNYGMTEVRSILFFLASSKFALE
jgi:hypothetical protein